MVDKTKQQIPRPVRNQVAQPGGGIGAAPSKAEKRRAPDVLRN